MFIVPVNSLKFSSGLFMCQINEIPWTFKLADKKCSTYTFQEKLLKFWKLPFIRNITIGPNMSWIRPYLCVKYHLRAIITCSWFETALDYKTPIYVLNKEILQFFGLKYKVIIESGFKSRTGYNGAQTKINIQVGSDSWHIWANCNGIYL